MYDFDRFPSTYKPTIRKGGSITGGPEATACDAHRLRRSAFLQPAAVDEAHRYV